MFDFVIFILMVWNRKVFVEVAKQISSFAIRMHISGLKLKSVVYKAKRISFMWLLAHIFMMIATVLLFNKKQRGALGIFKAYTFNLVDSELLQQHKGLLLFVAGVMTFMWNFASMLFVSFHSIVCLFLSSIIDTLNKKIGMVKMDEIRELFDILNYVDIMIRYVDRSISVLAFFTFLNVLGICIELSTQHLAFIDGFKMIFLLYNFALSLHLVIWAAEVDDIGLKLRMSGHGISWKKPQFAKGVSLKLHP
ncbi:hypothetical protein TNCV_4092511 [Trichonephila clavipes]|nr:hypothetical protein TNCV_4092511 [Trichonephila clavipes]